MSTENTTVETIVEKFLTFNEKEILFRKIEGQYWVAVKPICEALNVDYIRQFKNLKDDDFLSGVLSNQTMHDTTKRSQEMMSIPEFYVYGWLLSLKAKSNEYKAFKWKCYEVLFLHFNGTITKRSNYLEQSELEKTEKKQILKRLRESADYKRLKIIEENTTARNKALRKLDAELVSNQTEMNL